MDEDIRDEIYYEDLDDISPNWETRSLKVRCSSCKKVILVKLKELKQKFARRGDWVTLQRRYTIRIPFTKIEFFVYSVTTEKRYLNWKVIEKFRRTIDTGPIRPSGLGQRDPKEPFQT